MFGLSKLLRAGEGRMVKRLSKIADQVMDLDEEYAALTCLLYTSDAADE